MCIFSGIFLFAGLRSAYARIYSLEEFYSAIVSNIPEKIREDGVKKIKWTIPVRRRICSIGELLTRFGIELLGVNSIDYLTDCLKNEISSTEIDMLRSSCNLYEFRSNIFWMSKAYKKFADEIAGMLPPEQSAVFGSTFLVNWEYGGEIVATAEPVPDIFDEYKRTIDGDDVGCVVVKSCAIKPIIPNNFGAKRHCRFVKSSFHKKKARRVRCIYRI